MSETFREAVKANLRIWEQQESERGLGRSKFATTLCPSEIMQNLTAAHEAEVAALREAPMPDTTLVTRIYPPDARGWRRVTRGDKVTWFGVFRGRYYDQDGPSYDVSVQHNTGTNAPPWAPGEYHGTSDGQTAALIIAEALGVEPGFRSVLTAVLGPVEEVPLRR